MPLCGAHRDAEQLHPVAELARRFEILRGDRRDALDEHRLRIDLGAEGDAREDRELLGGVEALDVEGRIGLGIAEALGILETVGERQLLLLHAGEDVVAGAVEDAVDAREGIAGEPLAQRLHDRDRAADRRLEIERDAVLLGERRELEAVLGEQRLVGGDDRFASRQRGLDRALRRIALPAHQLDEDVDLGVGCERDGVGDPTRLRAAEVTRPRGIAGRDRDHVDRRGRSAAPARRGAAPRAAPRRNRPCRARQDPLSAARPWNVRKSR